MKAAARGFSLHAASDEPLPQQEELGRGEDRSENKPIMTSQSNRQDDVEVVRSIGCVTRGNISQRTAHAVDCKHEHFHRRRKA